MSISGLKLNNYKSFENASIDIKPITVLVGTNSSGKSSLLQILLLLAQSFNTHRKRQKALKVFGKYVELGEIENIFFNKDKNKEIEFEISLSRPAPLQPQLKRISSRILGAVRRVIFQYCNILQDVVYEDDSKSLKTIITALRDRTYYSTENLVNSITKAGQAIRRLRKIQKQYSEIFDSLGEDIKEYYANDYGQLLDEFDPLEAKRVANAILDLKNYKAITSVSYKFVYNKTNESAMLSSVCIKSDEVCILQISYLSKKKRTSKTLKSDLLTLNALSKYRSKFFKNCGFRGLRLLWTNRSILPTSSIAERSSIESSSAFFVYSLVNEPTKQLGRFFSFNGIRHVSPIRAYPKRYYMADEITDTESWNTFDSDKLATIIKSKPEIKTEINYWLSKLDIEIDIEKLNYLIHSIKVKQNELMLDLTDVGFGVSQILPVIIQPILASRNSITIIEQPEIHIHPKAQADLADFFIDIVKNSNKKLIIETHSEALLKRLRRRMAESTENLEGAITPNDVSIHYISKRNSKSEGASIQNIDISSSGAFNWPNEFSDFDINDTVNFIKYQK